MELEEPKGSKYPIFEVSEPKYYINCRVFMKPEASDIGYLDPLRRNGCYMILAGGWPLVFILDLAEANPRRSKYPNVKL